MLSAFACHAAQVQRCRPVEVGVDVNTMRKQLVHDDPLADDRDPQR